MESSFLMNYRSFTTKALMVFKKMRGVKLVLRGYWNL